MNNIDICINKLFGNSRPLSENVESYFRYVQGHKGVRKQKLIKDKNCFWKLPKGERGVKTLKVVNNASVAQ